MNSSRLKTMVVLWSVLQILRGPAPGFGSPQEETETPAANEAAPPQKATEESADPAASTARSAEESAPEVEPGIPSELEVAEGA